MPVKEDPKLRILLLADTHIGFDLPFKPKVNRRRRGHDFMQNFELALAPALEGKIDIVVHGGDLLFRSRVPPALVEMALAPLIRVAETGPPVYLVPGNHERSRIPFHLWGRHPRLFIFDKPRTFIHDLDGFKISLSGFPFTRRIRDRFAELIHSTGYQTIDADLKFLCLHQTVEGAKVGPVDFTFRRGEDIIRGKDLPRGFAAVLAGHIHRSQVLWKDLRGLPLAAPVIYPGSIERTSIAERDEVKSYTLVEVQLAAEDGNRQVRTEVIPLPARPMMVLTLTPPSIKPDSVGTWLKAKLGELDPNAVVQLRLTGPHAETTVGLLTASRLRELAPPTMNINISGRWRGRRVSSPESRDQVQGEERR